MLLPDNIHPKNSIYYNGAFVLKRLQEHQSMDLLQLYAYAKQEHTMSMPVFVLSLDWLFLLGLITFNQQGEVALCS